MRPERVDAPRAADVLLMREQPVIVDYEITAVDIGLGFRVS